MTELGELNIPLVILLVTIIIAASGCVFFRRKISEEPRVPIDNPDGSDTIYRTHEYYVGAYLFSTGLFCSSLIGLFVVLLIDPSLKKSVKDSLNIIITTALGIAVAVFFADKANIKVKGACALVAGILLGIVPVINQ